MIDDTILQRLTAKDPATRIKAIIELRKLGFADASETLVSMLDEEDTELRQSIISTLMEIGKPAIPYLIEALRFPNPLIQKAAAQILSEIGDASISADILNLLKDSSGSVRASVIEVLGGIKDFWSLEYIRTFLNDPEPNVRISAVKALGNFEDKLSIDLLLSLLSDSDVAVRIATIEVLSKFNEIRICDALWQVISSDDNQQVKDSALISLKIIGEKILKNYENSFTSKDVGQRAKTLQELSAFGKTIILPLIDFSRHRDPSVRELCAQIMGNIKDNIATRRLIELANDLDLEVRLAAINALSKIKSESALRFLISLLKTPDTSIISAVSGALTRVGKELVHFFPVLLAEQDLNTQITITRIIGNIGDADVVNMIAEQIKTPQMWLRRALCFALGETKNPLAANVLIDRCMSDPETLVRTAAAKALGKLKVTIGIQALLQALHDKEETVQLAAIEALTEIGEASIGAYLMPFLSNKTISLKIAAIRALTHLNYFGAIPELKKLVRIWPFSKEVDEVKDEAKAALKKLEYEMEYSKP